MRRLAVYAAPRPDTAWHDRAAAWLGRSPEGVDHPGHLHRPEVLADRLPELTAAAARYGFHATLRNPFVPAPGVDADHVEEAVASLAARLAPLEPRLRIDLLAGFPAFVPAGDDGLDELAAACVRGCAEVAAEPTAEELARRRRAGLSTRQEELLVRWGYPYVMEEFRYHMTLARRLAPDEVEPVLDAAREHFAELDDAAFPLDDLVLFEQVDGGPCQVRSRHRLGGVSR